MLVGAALLLLVLAYLSFLVVTGDARSGSGGPSTTTGGRRAESVPPTADEGIGDSPAPPTEAAAAANAVPVAAEPPDRVAAEESPDDFGDAHEPSPPAPEPLRVTLTKLSEQCDVERWGKISVTHGHADGVLASLGDRDEFGASLAWLGDLDGNGVADIAVGAPGDDDAGEDAGAVWLLFLDEGGRATSGRKILPSPSEPDADLEEVRLGATLDSAPASGGDSLVHLAIGAPTRWRGRGGHVALRTLGAHGEVVAAHDVTISDLGGDAWRAGRFGHSVCFLGDLDRNGMVDVAVGSPDERGCTRDTGVVWILFLSADLTPIAARRISCGAGGFAGRLEGGDGFGDSVTRIGDADHDGVREIAVGAPGDKLSPGFLGAIWILELDASGAVTETTRLAPDVLEGYGTDWRMRAFEPQPYSADVQLGDLRALSPGSAGRFLVGTPRPAPNAFDSGTCEEVRLGPDLAVTRVRRWDLHAELGGLLDHGDRIGSSVLVLDIPGERLGKRIFLGAPGDGDGDLPGASEATGAVWWIDLADC